MVLKITTGYSPEYLLKEVATGRENYYTGAVTEGEPPGRWWGAGAEKLGLAGLVDAQDMRAVYERFLDPRAEGFTDPSNWNDVATLGHAGRKYLSEDDLYNAAIEREPYATPERRAELRTEAGRRARHNVAFYDVTFNIQKSVTLVHTAFEAKEVAARRAGRVEEADAWGQFRKAVEDAIWAGNNAGLGYLAEHAGYTRVGHHGGAAGRWADAHEWVVASFFQHDSREHDPHLHIHNALLNRVEGPNGEWLTVDSKALYKFRPGAAAVAERTTEERITHALGVLVATRPDGKAREIVGVAKEAMDLISTRRRKLTAKAEELVTAFEARHGRAPNGLERDRIAQQATLLTRRAKSHTGETREQLLDRIDARIRADIDGGLGGVADTVLAARGNAVAPMRWSPQAVIDVAIAEVQRRKAGWNRGDLTGAINAALPDYLGLPDGADVARLLESLTEAALRQVDQLDEARPGDQHLPAELRLANGDSSYQAPGGRLYATPEQVRTERALVAATAAGGATALPRPVAQQLLDDLRSSGIELGVDQAAAVRGVLTSGARIETLVGPAGTGKSFVVGMIARGWTHPHTTTTPASGEAAASRRVFGLATSQIATEVLAGEGLTTRNVAQWLATQDYLAANPTVDNLFWQLRPGDLVVVDESAMTDTASLAAIHRYVDRAGAKLLLVGDHRQLAAVGAGGAMDLLATAGTRYELAEARRFSHAWERDATLRLRAGDDTVLRTYHHQGRLLDAGSREQAEASAARAWLADTLAGKRSLLLVDTNDQAAHLAAQLRAELVRLGRVSDTDGTVPLASQGTTAGVGDLVQARFNGWDLAGRCGNRRGPINRETYQVTAVRADGGLEVTPLDASASPERVGERMVLPARYVAEHLALAYASTVHAAQGQTVDSSHAVITPSTAHAALYVALSRGRDANTAHIATLTTVEDPAQGNDTHRLHRDPTAVLAAILDNRDPITAQSALALAAQSAAEVGNVRTPAELLADAAQLAATERTTGWLDELAATGGLTEQQRVRIAAENGAASLTRVLRRAEIAGHDPQQVLREAVREAPLAGAKNTTNVLHSRITNGNTRRFDPLGTTYREWVPRTGNPEWDSYLGVLADAADTRAAELGRTAAAEQPAWAVEALGPALVGGPDRLEWERRAGIVAGYRELRGHDDPADALGRAPKAGQVEQYAAYRAAWTALGRPEVDQALDELSDGQLRARIVAWEREKTWGPAYVGNELAGTRQAAVHQRHTATLRRAEAAATTDSQEVARLTQEASDAAALAAILDGRVADLERVDEARAIWWAHSASTRAEADQSRYLLAERHADTEPEPTVTGAEWLAAEHQARVEDDAHRTITETDLAPEVELDREDVAVAVPPAAEQVRDNDDDAQRRAAPAPEDELVGDQPDRGQPAHPAPSVDERDRDERDRDVRERDERGVDERGDNREAVMVEVGVPDIREVAAAEPDRPTAEAPRVAKADEVTVLLAGAHRSLAEVHARADLDAREEDDHRAAELARWHTEHLASHADVDNHTASTDNSDYDDGGPVLEREPVGIG